jgi:PST family polysaccharide transporter
VFSTLRTILARPGVRGMVHNFGWIVGDKVVRLLFSVWIGFVVARYLGPAQFGALSYALAIVTIGLLLAEGGLEAVVKREILREPGREASLLAEAGLLRLLIGGLLYAGLMVALAYGWGPPQERSLLAVLGLMLFQPVLFVPDLWFQARLESRVSVTSQTAALVAGAAARLALVAGRAPLLAFAWVGVAEVALAGSLLWWRARRRGLGLAVAVGLAANVRRLWGDAWPLLASGLAVAVYMRIDAVMLRQIAGEAAVGQYAAAVKFTEVWLFLPGALAVSALPELIRSRAAGRDGYARRLAQYCDVSALMAYALALPTALLAPWLIRVAYGPAYAAAAPVLVVHAWVLVFAALGVVRGQYCVNEGLTRFHLVATVLGAILNVALNYWLIPSYGPQGAAIATLASQALAAWISTFFIAATRELAWMQTRSLLNPFRALRHVRPTA